MPTGFRAFVIVVSAALIFDASPARSQTLTYDEQGRVATAVYPDGTQILYCYDFAGNRLQYVVSATTPGCGLAVANVVAATAPQNSTNNPITLNIYGGTPTSVAVSTAPPYGTASASGVNITYSPRPGTTLRETFKYTATNAYGTSYPAVVNMTTVPAAGDVLFSSTTPGSYAFTIPSTAPGFVTVMIYGGGGGSKVHGGGGGGFSQKHFAVTPGTTVIAGAIGSGGLPFLGSGSPPTGGGTTSVASPGMDAGGGDPSGTIGGSGGFASGGDINTAGETGDTGGTGNGGANLGQGGGPRQTNPSKGGYAPGGGGAGQSSFNGGGGAAGQVIIIGQTS